MSKEQEGQMKMMTNMMLIFIGIASLSISTGIAIYWITNNTFTIIQNLLVKRSK
jgi:membrane protein insertase Oxa1/YidC/SpoIIIJ